MDSQLLDKTQSEPNLSIIDDDSTVRNFVSTRTKRKRCEDFDDFRQEMKELFDDWTEKQNKQLQKLFPILNNIQEANKGIEASITFLAEQNTEFKKKIEQMELEIKKKNEYIAIIEDRLEDTLRNSRKTCIEIRNVPVESQETKEGLVGMVDNLAKTLNTNLTKSDIKDIYKSKGPTERKSIIVELSSTLTKEQILKSAKAYNLRNRSNKLAAKHLGINKFADTPIFVCENLTPKASRLYFLARDLKKTKDYKFCWTSYGRVFLRKDEQSPIIQVHNELQIQKLINE
ncbi:hypothetical protein ABMA27_007674 [Loxostege sticticalis]|uniref:FP protein C-terminal domain-containing protein n=1 Tax=Loxostege sticticalis TaxID=481309 RepID=A0ABR3HGA7_LOXSC